MIENERDYRGSLRNSRRISYRFETAAASIHLECMCHICAERKMSMISRSFPSVRTTPGLAEAHIDGKFLAWMLFAVGILAIATFVIAVSPPPDVDNLMAIDLMGP